MSKPKSEDVPAYVFPNRKMAPVGRLEPWGEVDPASGDPVKLLQPCNQRMIDAQQIGPGVCVEIATAFDENGRPKEWTAVVLKAGEARRFATILNQEADRAIDCVVYHRKDALQYWQDIQLSIAYAQKNEKK